MPLLNIHLKNPNFKSDKRKTSVNKTTPLPPPLNPKKMHYTRNIFNKGFITCWTFYS